jgi:hypothetical protein
MKATIQFDFMEVKAWFREYCWQAFCHALGLRAATINRNTNERFYYETAPGNCAHGLRGDDRRRSPARSRGGGIFGQHTN